MSYEQPDMPQRDFGVFLDNVYGNVSQVKDAKGALRQVKAVDTEVIFWAGQAIGSDRFGGLADMYGKVLSLENRAHENLPTPWADAMVRHLTAARRGTKITVAAKNSETIRMGQSVSSLQDKASKNRTERIYSTSEEASRSLSHRLVHGRDPDEA